MPALKSDLYITIRAGQESFSIGGVKMLDGKYLIKRGRTRAKRIPFATLTQIFTEARKWAVRKI